MHNAQILIRIKYKFDSQLGPFEPKGFVLPWALFRMEEKPAAGASPSPNAHSSWQQPLPNSGVPRIKYLMWWWLIIWPHGGTKER